MTRCSRDDVNLIKLKSSVYNQTGENYHQQLNLHRSMCAHVRRIFSAKSVVDTKNPRYVRTMQRRCRPLSCRRKLLEPCLNNVIIDRLAYDTEHHPSQILKAQCRSKSNSKERSCSREKQRAASDRSCPCARQTSPRERPSTAKSSPKNRKRCEIDLSSCMGQTRRRNSEDIDEPRMYNQRRASSPCPSTRSRKCKFEAKRQQQQQQNQRQVFCGSATRQKRSSRNDEDDEDDYDDDDEDVDCTADDECCNGKGTSRSRPTSNSQRRRGNSSGNKNRSCREESLMRKAAERGDDEARYAKFVYDITQEIVQNGLYTDDELRQVFHEHVERNSACLSKRRMLYEIYQLKISLNMESDSCEEDDDMIFAENFVEHRVPKPPTPPKVLNDNKVVEKLESFRMQDCPERNGLSSPCCKNVVFVDANPEFLVTERDVLCTLMDNDVHPQQIQRIYRNLFQKSKDMSLCEAVQVGSEVAYTHRLKQVDKSSSMTSLCPKSPGILRRKSPEIVPPPDLSHQRFDCIQNKQKEALEKCAKWNISEGCGCKAQPCKHTKEFEPERKMKSLSNSQKYCNCEKSCEREIEQSAQKVTRNRERPERDKSVSKKSPDRKPKTPTKPLKSSTPNKSATSQPKQLQKEVRAKSASRVKATTIATPPRSVKRDLPSAKSRQKPKPAHRSPTPDPIENLHSARSRSSSPPEEVTRKSTPSSSKPRKIRRSVTPVDSDVSESRSIDEEIDDDDDNETRRRNSSASPDPPNPKKSDKIKAPTPTPDFSDDEKSVKEEIDSDGKDDDDNDNDDDDDDDDQGKSSKSSAGFISMAKRRQSTFSIIPLPIFKPGSPQKKIFHSGQAGPDGDELTIVSSVLPSRMRTPEFTPEQAGSDHTGLINANSSSGTQNMVVLGSLGDQSSSSRKSGHQGSTRMGQPVDAREIRDALNELKRDSDVKEQEEEFKERLSLVLEEDEAEGEASTTVVYRSHPPDRSTAQDTSSSDDDPPEHVGRHQQHRYPTVRDYMERFAAGEDASPESWRQPSAASSDSTSSLDDEFPTGERPMNGAAAALVNSSTDGSRRPLAPPQRKRASSGFGGYQVMDTWNDNLSELPHEPNNPIDESPVDSSRKQPDQRRRGR